MNTPEEITINEVVGLLEQLTARDQRTSGDADLTTWWHDLNAGGVSYRDAQQAANYYYAVVWPAQNEQDRYRLTAPKIIELVGRVHRERLENFIYQPTLGETGAEFIANYNRQRNAVASGQVPPVPSITQALKPRPVAALIAGVAAARVLPPEIADVIARRRPPGTSITCPACHARPNERCRTGHGRELKTMHPSRLETWATGNVPCTACGAETGAPCTEYGHAYRGGTHRERTEAATDGAP